MEDVRGSLDNEKARLQNQVRDMEKEQLQVQHRASNLQDELQRAQASGNQQQVEERELQARLLNEVEERERAHQDIHNLRKQVRRFTQIIIVQTSVT